MTTRKQAKDQLSTVMGVADVETSIGSRKGAVLRRLNLDWQDIYLVETAPERWKREHSKNAEILQRIE